MIAATELRIGNWVQLDTGFTLPSPHKIRSKDIYDIDEGNVNAYSLEPIPLTPEILEKAGFEVEYTNGGWLRWQKGEFKLLDRRLSHPQYHAVEAMILHVHELQNLYYALTKTELTLPL